MSTAVRAGFRRQPALDGVRAVAVVLVLLFHQGWLSGGYVGVSVFFTLSGYLITALAFVEHAQTGRLDVAAFYGRRIRRLLPASLACLLGVVPLVWLGLLADVEHLRRDLWAALLQVYNWVALSGGQTYADLVAGQDAPQSPLDHYWSLAIEEQFYWVWPLALVVILRRPARGRTVLIGALTLLFAASAPLIASLWGGDAAYWATPARLAEVLVGALLAAVLHSRGERSLPRPTRLLAPAGLAVIMWAAIAWPRASGPANGGWLPVLAVASAALLAGLQVPSGLRRALSSRPLVVLGAISYGVYLFHWPVFVVLDERRTHLPSVPLFALRLLVTLGLAVVSFRRLEAPVRRARPKPLVAPAGAAVACAAVAVAVLLVPASSTPYWAPQGATAATLPPVTDPAQVAALTTTTSAPAAATTAAGDVSTATTPETTTDTTPAVAVLADSGTIAPASTTPTTLTVPTTTSAPIAPPLPEPPPRPVRVLVVGDSTAMATSQGLAEWAGAHPQYAVVVAMAEPGCGFIPDGRQRGDVTGFAEKCRQRRALVDAELPALLPDVVVGMVTLADIDERIWDEAEGQLGPFDPRFYERLVAAYDAATTTYLGAGATDVLWVVPPVPAVAYGPDDEYLSDPARYERYAQALRDVAVAHPGQVTVVDLAAWLATQPAMPERPDGLHWSPDGSFWLADQFLSPVIVSAAVT